MKLGWLSDIHLNFLDDASRGRFLESLSVHPVDAWLLSGDVGEATSIVGYLQELAREIQVPMYFVLGNHDFYRGSIRGVVAEVASMARSSDRLAWLTSADPEPLAANVAVVGDDGWADGRLGDPLGTPVELNDFYLIEELTGHPRAELVQRLNRLGDHAAARLGPKLEDAAERHAHVVVVTHAPPFEGATWHEGEISSPDWLPWFSCDAVGSAILRCAETHSETRFLVLCGHTHSPGQYSPRPNVAVLTARATYGHPVVQAVIELDGSSVARAA